MPHPTSSKKPERRSKLAYDCLAHDLNNVFQTVIEAADLIRPDPKWSGAAEIILRSVDQGRRIVESVVESHGAATLEEIVASAAEFASDYASASDGPGLTITRSVEPGLRCTGRASMIERALVNLFVNSAEAAHAHGATHCAIHVHAAVDRGGVLITITDDGPGFPADVLPVVFAPRFTTKQGGAGLGLYIVRRAIAESGGAVEARNGEQGGAVFEISLPAATSDGVRRAQSESTRFGC